LKVELGVIQSQASVTCVGGVPNYAGSSNVASLKINGLPVTVGSGPLTIPLVIGALKLNSTQVSNGQVVQQAVAVETILGDIVIAESKADVHGTPFHPNGNPCQP
jgi:hypothetical protein